MENAKMKRAKFFTVAIAVSVAGLVAAQAPQNPPTAPDRGGGGRGGAAPAGAPGGRGGPARGITINGNPVQKAHADLAGAGVTGTADFNEFAMGNGSIVQVILNVQGLPVGMHGVHIHTIGKCDPPGFTTAGGHFDPGPAGNPDADLNHPFHSGDLPNLNVTQGPNGTAGTMTAYTTRFGLGGPLSLFDADGSAIVIHANPDLFATGTAGQGLAGGPRIACGVITKG